MKFLVIIYLIFEFNLSQVNKVKPKQVEKINVKSMINKGQFEDVNRVIEDFSQENFEENGNFFILLFRLF